MTGQASFSQKYLHFVLFTNGSPHFGQLTILKHLDKRNIVRINYTGYFKFSNITLIPVSFYLTSTLQFTRRAMTTLAPLKQNDWDLECGEPVIHFKFAKTPEHMITTMEFATLGVISTPATQTFALL